MAPPLCHCYPTTALSRGETEVYKGGLRVHGAGTAVRDRAPGEPGCRTNVCHSPGFLAGLQCGWLLQAAQLAVILEGKR
jgi:hypothetical protein